MSLTVMAIFRNEAPYLAEWMAFHLLQGVDRFLLFNNQSTDDWRPVADAFSDVATVVKFDHPAPCQLEAYSAGLTMMMRGETEKPEWVAVLDCDEFLFSPTGQPLPKVMGDLGTRTGASGIAVNWMVFGHSNHANPPKGLTIENYLLRPPADNECNRHIKSIVRPETVRAIGTPHHFHLGGGRVVDELGRHVPGPFTETATHETLRINHYLTRSRSEWAAKVARGRADTGTFRDPAEIELYHGDVEDRLAAVWSNRVKKVLWQRGLGKKEDRSALASV